ncbi:MAG: hypothetical protein NVSMB59_23290 [Vulcanimicrobiaceae bacterium]
MRGAIQPYDNRMDLYLHRHAHRCVRDFRAFVRNDRGQGLVEYALIVVLVSIVAID